MKNLILLLALTLSTSQSLIASEENYVEEEQQDQESYYNDSPIDFDIVDKGYRLQPTSAYKNYTFIPYRLDVVYMSRQIKRINYKLTDAEIDDLAKAISKVTMCLNIDTWVLAGLIQKESSFVKTAVSGTNAAGLTQFTTSGINEVHDQLGLNGIVGAPAEITEYYRNKIYQCINVKWVDPWKLVKVKPGHPQFINQIKTLLKKDTLIAVTYGAILLKTYVANMDNRNIVNNLGYTTADVYYYALQNYNGEPGDAKVRYAQTIFRHIVEMHPKPNMLNFPFLK